MLMNDNSNFQPFPEIPPAHKYTHRPLCNFHFIYFMFFIGYYSCDTNFFYYYYSKSFEKNPQLYSNLQTLYIKNFNHCAYVLDK